MKTAQLGACFFTWFFLNVMYNITNKKCQNAFPMPWTMTVVSLFVGTSPPPRTLVQTACAGSGGARECPPVLGCTRACTPLLRTSTPRLFSLLPSFPPSVTTASCRRPSLPPRLLPERRRSVHPAPVGVGPAQGAEARQGLVEDAHAHWRRSRPRPRGCRHVRRSPPRTSPTPYPSPGRPAPPAPTHAMSPPPPPPLPLPKRCGL